MTQKTIEEIKERRQQLLETLAQSNEIEGVKFLQGAIAGMDWVVNDTSNSEEEVN